MLRFQAGCTEAGISVAIRGSRRDMRNRSTGSRNLGVLCKVGRWYENKKIDIMTYSEGFEMRSILLKL